MPGKVTKKFKCKIEMAERASATFIRMPFDVKEVFGTGRLPVKLTINDYNC